MTRRRAPTSELLTDLENARRFTDEHQDDLRYVAKWKRWHVWDGKRWRPDDTGEVQRRAKATVRGLYESARHLKSQEERRRRLGFAAAAQSAKRIDGMIRLATSESPFPVTPDQLDANPLLLNVENGTLDLWTGELRRHRRADLITKIAPVVYDPNAACPTLEAFLDRIMPGDPDRIRYVQKIFGYALTGDAREQCFFIFHGTGANGKTTLTTAVTKAVGGYAQHTPTDTLLVKRADTIPNDVARLHGARLVTAAEAECNRQLAEALVKQLTGGDKIAARFLHGEFFEFVPTFKLFLAVNHKPVIRGTDHAIWRRVRLIPFDVTIPDSEQDKSLPEKLEAERAGILRWAVEGCLAWQLEGLEPPKAVTEATDDYREEMDTVGAFIDECCTRDSEAETPTKELYDRYTQWCDGQREKPATKAEFGARLAEKGFTPARTKGQRLWRGLSVTR
jgi:putative DNA primase/helicase